MYYVCMHVQESAHAKEAKRKEVHITMHMEH